MTQIGDLVSIEEISADLAYEARLDGITHLRLLAVSDADHDPLCLYEWVDGSMIVDTPSGWITDEDDPELCQALLDGTYTQPRNTR